MEPSSNNELKISTRISQFRPSRRSVFAGSRRRKGLPLPAFVGGGGGGEVDLAAAAPVVSNRWISLAWRARAAIRASRMPGVPRVGMVHVQETARYCSTLIVLAASEIEKPAQKSNVVEIVESNPVPCAAAVFGAIITVCEFTPSI